MPPPPPNTLEHKIYHYTGRELACRPEFDISESYNQLFLKYFSMTPWFSFETLGNIANSIRRQHNLTRNQFLIISNMLVERKRAFFGDKRHFEILKQIFQIKDNEVFIDFPEPVTQYILTLINEMRNSQGKKIFFIITFNYEPIRNMLLQSGFIEGADFFDAGLLLSEDQGVRFNSNFIIRDM